MTQSRLHDAAQCAIAFHDSLSRGKRRTKHWRLLRALAENTLQSVDPETPEIDESVEFPTNALVSWLSAEALVPARSRAAHAARASGGENRLDTGNISKIWRTLEAKIQEHEHDLLDIARTRGHQHIPRLRKTAGGGSGIQSVYAIIPEPVTELAQIASGGIVILGDIDTERTTPANFDPASDWRTAFYETWVCSFFAGVLSGLICGVIYAFGPLPVTEDPESLSNATWYFRVLRFLFFGTITIFFYGIFYGISNARKTDPDFITRPWTPLVYLGAAVVVVLLLYAGVNAADTPILKFFLSEDRQGDVRVELLQLSVSIGLYIMAMFCNFKHTSGFDGRAFCRRGLSSPVLLLLSGGLLVWPWFGEGIGPDTATDLYLPIPVGLRALIIVVVFNIWGFICYYLMVQPAGPLKVLEDTLPVGPGCAFCESLISRVRQRWNRDWYF